MEMGETRLKLLPMPKLIVRPLPQVGDSIYAIQRNLLNFWLKATVVEKVYDDDRKQASLVLRVSLHKSEFD